MKNPHPLSETWNSSINKEPVLISVPGTNKRFKRKSREPKRLFSSPEPERMSAYPVDVSDMDSVDDTQIQVCNISGAAPLQRQLLRPQEATAGSTGILLGHPEANASPAQSGAIDMRIGINVPAITSKLSQLPASPFSNPEISHWPAAISQPLSNRLKLGLRSTFPLSTSSSSSLSPSHQAFSLDPSLSGQTDPRTSQTSHCHEHVEPEVQSPKVNM